MSASLFCLFRNGITDEDSDEEDLEIYTDVGLKEQLYITLSRRIQIAQDTETKIYQLEHKNKVRQTAFEPTQNTLDQLISTTKTAARVSLNPPQYEFESKFNKDQLIPDFEYLHQSFAQQLSDKIFDSHLASTHLQRAFMTITPQHIGLTDYSLQMSNIRSRRRTVFNYNNKPNKGFTNDADSCYDIPTIQRDRKLFEYMQTKKQQHYKNPDKLSSIKGKSWQKLFALGMSSRKKKESLTLEDPSIIDIINIPNLVQSQTATTSKDDMLGNIDNKPEYINNKTLFEVNKITDTIDSKKLKRGDLIFLMDYEMIDIQNEDVSSFVKKYKLGNFLKLMNQKSIERRCTIMQQIEQIRQQSSKSPRSNLKPKQNRHLTTVSADNVDNFYEIPIQTRSRGYDPFSSRPRASTYLCDKDKEMKSNELQIFENYNKMGAAHCMIVLRTVGVSVEVAHVTSHGATRSLIRQFDAESVAKSLYLQMDDNENKSDHEENNHFGKGPPMVYRCVVYRLNSQFVPSRKLANEAANVAENLIQNGRVLSDPKLFGCSMDRYLINGNPEKYFYQFLLTNDKSLFRRTVRLEFDEGTQFLNFSSSEFVALCLQRALVNKKSFDRQLIRILDISPHLTPPALLQKYLHLNIDKYGDWTCLGNIFYSYL